MALPDFYIIGAMKCGTTTLHDQLALQPQFFMATPKEPNFFSDDDIYAKGFDWYQDLFANAPAGAIRGESSTHYTKLPTHPHTIDRLAKATPGAKFIYVMRHPIDRLISHYIHAWSERETSAPIDKAVDNLPRLTEYSRYAYQLKPWINRFGKENILPVFFERMTAHQQEELSRVAAFLGAEGEVTWREAQDPSNVSSKRMRKHPALAALIDNPVSTLLRRTIVPQSLRDKVKAQLTMQERPAAK